MKLSKKITIYFLFFATAFSISAIAQTNETAVVDRGTYYQRGEVNHAVLHVLKLMDAGDYANLSSQTSRIATKDMSEDASQSVLKGIRAAFGTYKDRVEERIGFSSKMLTGETGKFYAVVFKSEFASMVVEEKVIMSLEDGQWKLAGYFLQPYRTK